VRWRDLMNGRADAERAPGSRRALSWRLNSPERHAAFGAFSCAYPETGLCAGVVPVIRHPPEISLGNKLGNAPVGSRRLRGAPA
jgi:hypothetical protein